MMARAIFGLFAIAAQVHLVAGRRQSLQMLDQEEDAEHAHAHLSVGSSRSSSKAIPSEILTCSAGTAILTTTSMTEAKYDAIAASVTALYHSLSTECGNTNCERADWAGCVLRMAGHDFMDFKDGVGGSDACTDMAHVDNAGLSACLHQGEHGVSLQQAYSDHCTDVSLADFIVIAAQAIMTETRSHANVDVSGIYFKEAFSYGRTTSTSCDGAAHLLPDPLRGCDAIQDTFLNNMALSWRESAALMGVHSLGRAKIENSGFHGWWSDPVNSGIFNNDYYISLMAKGWVVETSVQGQTVKSQWGRSDNRRDTSFDGHEFMLDTDMCLAYTENNVPVSSLTHDCCGWTTLTVGGQRCGNPTQCCGQDRPNDCGNRGNPSGPAASDVIEFGDNEDIWLWEFQQVWKKATENGFSSLTPLMPSATTPGAPTTTTTTAAQVNWFCRVFSFFWFC